MKTQIKDTNHIPDLVHFIETMKFAANTAYGIVDEYRSGKTFPKPEPRTPLDCFTRMAVELDSMIEALEFLQKEEQKLRKLRVARNMRQRRVRR